MALATVTVAALVTLAIVVCSIVLLLTRRAARSRPSVNRPDALEAKYVAAARATVEQDRTTHEASHLLRESTRRATTFA